jgi:hypothetical protein
MAKKLIGKWSKGSATAKAYWSADDQEYTVRLWCGNTERKGATYFTDDKSDAVGTAKAMLEHNNCDSRTEPPFLALGCTCERKRR